MKNIKITSLFVPPFAGLMAMIIFAQIRSSAINHFSAPDDAVFSFEPLFDFLMFLPFYLVIYAAATFVQILALILQEGAGTGKKFFGLTFIQLLILACVVFGIGTGTYAWYPKEGILKLTIKVFTCIFFTTVYWYVNIKLTAMFQKMNL